ncbi:MAG: hypothetical protein AB1447_00040 [Bacillota bacterium]
MLWSLKWFRKRNLLWVKPNDLWASVFTKGRIQPEHARQVDLPAGFAFYTGVGQKTTMGMGQCMQNRRLEPGRTPAGDGAMSRKLKPYGCCKTGASNF